MKHDDDGRQIYKQQPTANKREQLLGLLQYPREGRAPNKHGIPHRLETKSNDMNLVGRISFLALIGHSIISASHALVEKHNHRLNRRDVLGSAATAAASLTSLSQPARAAAETTIDMSAINAARSKGPASLAEMVGVDIQKPNTVGDSSTNVDMDKLNQVRSKSATDVARSKNYIVPLSDPRPLLSIRGGINGKASIKIPRVGYSLYKTAPDQAARCTSLALRAGVRHLDLGTAYGSNAEVAKALKPYLDVGITGLDWKEEKPELLERLDATSKDGEEHAKSSTISSSGGGLGSLSPAPQGSAGRRGRREGLFVSHKISNTEQSTDPISVRRSVKASIATLGCSYLDMVSIHSPLTDKARRLESYKALLDLRDSGFVKSVGKFRRKIWQPAGHPLSFAYQGTAVRFRGLQLRGRRSARNSSSRLGSSCRQSNRAEPFQSAPRCGGMVQQVWGRDILCRLVQIVQRRWAHGRMGYPGQTIPAKRNDESASNGPVGNAKGVYLRSSVSICFQGGPNSNR